MELSLLEFDLKPGTRVRIEQTIQYRDREWATLMEGIIKAIRPEPTGSWYAHGKNDRLWLNRIDLQKDDGELTKVVVDQNTTITVLDGPAPVGGI